MTGKPSTADDSSAGGGNAAAGWRRALGSIEAAAIAGLIAAIGWAYVFSNFLIAPELGATEAEIISFYAAPNRGADAVWIIEILFVSTAGFLWFIGVVRNRAGIHGHRLFDTVFFGGAILLAGVLFAGSAALAAPFVVADAGGTVSAASAAATRSIAHILLAVLYPRLAALVVLSSSSLGLRSDAMPKWLAVTGYVVGAAVILDVTFSEPSIYAFPAWMGLVSIVLLLRRTVGQSPNSAVV